MKKGELRIEDKIRNEADNFSNISNQSLSNREKECVFHLAVSFKSKSNVFLDDKLNETYYA